MTLQIEKERSKNQCEICLKTFSKFGNLNTHVDVVHKNQNKSHCNFCKKDVLDIKSHVLQDTSFKDEK